MKLRILGLSLAVLITTIPLTSISSAAVKAGAKCKVVGQIKVKKSKEFTCIKLGKKLYWDNGVQVTKGLELEETFFGEMKDGLVIVGGIAEGSMTPSWIAKKVTNRTEKSTPQYWVVEDVINSNGQILETIGFMIPTLAPGDTFWAARQSRDFGWKSDPPFRTLLVSNEPFPVYSKADIKLTALGEIPKLQKYEFTNLTTELTQIRLTVANNSKNKYLDKSSDIHLVFIDEVGKPILSYIGTLGATLAPGGVGTALVAGQYSRELMIRIPQKFTRLEIGITHKLCPSGSSTYGCSY